VLKLPGRIGDDGLRALANSPYLGRLTTLCLNSTDRDAEAGVVALLRSPYLKNLTYLDAEVRLSEAARRVLLEARHVAWPGVDWATLTPELLQAYDARFGPFFHGYSAGWEEQLFPAMGDQVPG
jgi:hypothetical protein